MPSPVGHALLGLAVAEASPARFSERRWVHVALVAFLANLPDLDFLPGYLLGDPGLYHRTGFHSLAAALAVGALIALGCRVAGRGTRPYLLLGAALFTSHLLLDVTTPPGAPLLWPLSGAHLETAWSPFLSIEKAARSDGFLRSLLTAHNARAALWETVLLLPAVILSRWSAGWWGSRTRPFSTPLPRPSED